MKSQPRFFSLRKEQKRRYGITAPCWKFFLPVLILLAAGCAGPKPVMPPLASISGIKGYFRTGRIIRVDTGKVLSFDALINELGARDLIFIGERHDNPEQHLLEIRIRQALAARYGPLNTAMEFFQEQAQPALNRYISGASTEAEFLKAVNWKKEWGFAYRFYRPLMLSLREHGIPVFGINAPHAIVRKIARTGLKSLTPPERDRLAKDIDLGDKRHRAYLRDIYKIHAHRDLKHFDTFYEAQCVWEDTMAENIARVLKKDRKKMVVFTGSGHIINKFGIPGRTLRRVPVRMATVILYPLTGRAVIQKGSADYVWLTGNCSSMPFMRLHRPGRKMAHPAKRKASSRKKDENAVDIRR